MSNNKILASFLIFFFYLDRDITLTKIYKAQYSGCMRSYSAHRSEGRVKYFVDVVTVVDVSRQYMIPCLPVRKHVLLHKND